MHFMRRRPLRVRNRSDELHLLRNGTLPSEHWAKFVYVVPGRTVSKLKWRGVVPFVRHWPLRFGNRSPFVFFLWRRGVPA